MNDSSPRKSLDVADPRCEPIVRLRLECRRWDEIAHELRIPPRTLWDLRQQYQLDQLIAQIQADARAQIAEDHAALLREAQGVVRKWLRSGDSKLEAKAVKLLYPVAESMPASAETVRGGASEPLDRDRDRTAVVARAGAAAKRLRSG